MLMPHAKRFGEGCNLPMVLNATTPRPIRFLFSKVAFTFECGGSSASQSSRSRDGLLCVCSAVGKRERGRSVYVSADCLDYRAESELFFLRGLALGRY